MTLDGSQSLISFEYRGQPIHRVYEKIVANRNEENILNSKRKIYQRIIHCRTRIKCLDSVGIHSIDCREKAEIDAIRRE